MAHIRIIFPYSLLTTRKPKDTKLRKALNRQSLGLCQVTALALLKFFPPASQIIVPAAENHARKNCLVLSKCISYSIQHVWEHFRFFRGYAAANRPF